jgi:Tol biopolymer transport system component
MWTRTLFFLTLTGIMVASVATFIPNSSVSADSPSPSAPGAVYLPIIGQALPLHEFRALATSTYDGDSEIFALRGDGSERVQLTNNEVADEEPQWSPDGSQILWVQFAGLFPNKSYDDLWIMNGDGSNARPLTQMEGLERGSWSPDGTHIFYYNRVNGGDLYTAFTLYTTTPTGSPTLILANTYLQNYQWSPDGSHLLFIAVRRVDGGIVNDLYTVAADGSALTLITQDIRTAAWSPDGAWLVFDATREGNEDVYMVRANGNNLRKVTDGTMQDRFAGWVEGGERIVLKRTESDWGLGRYYLLSATGGTPDPFIMGSPSDDFITIEGIAPDGNAVVYSTITNQGYRYLEWQSTTSLTSTRISPANCASSCGVSGVSWSDEGNTLTYAFWQQPVPRIYNTQVYLVDLTSSTAPYRLLDASALNPVWLPSSPYLALDAAPAVGDASVRVPHIGNSRNGAMTRIPFIEEADFTTVEWRYEGN